MNPDLPRRSWLAVWRWKWWVWLVVIPASYVLSHGPVVYVSDAMMVRQNSLEFSERERVVYRAIYGPLVQVYIVSPTYRGFIQWQYRLFTDWFGDPRAGLDDSERN